MPRRRGAADPGQSVPEGQMVGTCLATSYCTVELYRGVSNLRPGWLRFDTPLVRHGSNLSPPGIKPKARPSLGARPSAQRLHINRAYIRSNSPSREFDPFPVIGVQCIDAARRTRASSAPSREEEGSASASISRRRSCRIEVSGPVPYQYMYRYRNFYMYFSDR